MRNFICAIYCIYIVIMRARAILALILVYLFDEFSHTRRCFVEYHFIAYRFVITENTPVFVLVIRVWAHIWERAALLFIERFANKTIALNVYRFNVILFAPCHNLRCNIEPRANVLREYVHYIHDTIAERNEHKSEIVCATHCAWVSIYEIVR